MSQQSKSEPRTFDPIAEANARLEVVSIAYDRLSKIAKQMQAKLLIPEGERLTRVERENVALIAEAAALRADLRERDEQIARQRATIERMTAQMAREVTRPG